MSIPVSNDFEIDFNLIKNDWAAHVDSWVKGESSLEPIHKFMIGRCISQMIKSIGTDEAGSGEH